MAIKVLSKEEGLERLKKDREFVKIQTEKKAKRYKQLDNEISNEYKRQLGIMGGGSASGSPVANPFVRDYVSSSIAASVKNTKAERNEEQKEQQKQAQKAAQKMFMPDVDIDDMVQNPHKYPQETLVKYGLAPQNSGTAPGAFNSGWDEYNKNKDDFIMKYAEEAADNKFDINKLSPDEQKVFNLHYDDVYNQAFKMQMQKMNPEFDYDTDLQNPDDIIRILNKQAEKADVEAEIERLSKQNEIIKNFAWNRQENNSLDDATWDSLYASINRNEEKIKDNKGKVRAIEEELEGDEYIIYTPEMLKEAQETQAKLYALNRQKKALEAKKEAAENSEDYRENNVTNLIKIQQEINEVEDSILALEPTREADFLEITYKSVERSFFEQKLNIELSKKAMGLPNEAKKYEEILSRGEFNFKADGTIAEGVSGALELLGQQVGNFADLKTLVTTAAGAGIGAVTGGPAGAVAGAGKGIKVGMSLNAGLAEMGAAYKEMIDLGISDDTAVVFAAIVGGINSGLEYLQLDELVKGVKILSKSGVDDKIVKKILTTLADRGIEVALETGQEITQESVAILASQLASRMEKGEWAYDSEDVKERLLATAKDSAIAFGFGTGIKTVGQGAAFVAGGGLKNTKNKKNVNEFPADSNGVRQVYAQSVYQSHSDETDKTVSRQSNELTSYRNGVPVTNNISQDIPNVNPEEGERVVDVGDGQKVKYSLMSFSNEKTNAQSSDTLAKKIYDNREKILNTEKAFDVNEQSIERAETPSLGIFNLFKKWGGKAVNPELGTVELTKSGAKSTVGHKIRAKKYIAASAIKDVIEKGIVINHETDWKGRGYDTYVIAAQGNVENRQSVVAVIVKNYPKNPKLNNKFYLHEIIEVGEISDTVNENEVSAISRMREISPTTNNITRGGGNVKVLQPEMADGTYVPVPQREWLSSFGALGEHIVSSLNPDARDIGSFQKAVSVLYEMGYSGAEFDKVYDTFKDLTYGNILSELDARRVHQAGMKDGARVRDGGVIADKTARGKVGAETIKNLTNIAKRLKVTIEFVDTLGDSNGLYKNGKIYISLDAVAESVANPYIVVASHEITHHMQTLSKKAYERFRSIAIKYEAKQAKMGEAEFINAKIKAYGDSGRALSRSEAMDEIAADFTQRVFENDKELSDFLRRVAKENRENKNALKKFIDSVKAVIRNIGEYIPNKDTVTINEVTKRFEETFNEAMDNAKARKEVKASNKVLYQLKENLGQQLKDWMSGKGKKYGAYNGRYFDLGTTPDVFIKHGADKLPVVMTENCVVKITGGKHAISLDEIAKLPMELNDPVLLFSSSYIDKNGNLQPAFIALTEMIDKYGNDVVAVVHINKYQDRMTVNRVASLYSKSDNITNENHIENYVKNQINSGKLLDASTKKASIWFTSRGLQLPKLVQTIIDANNNIPQNDLVVNNQYMQNGEKNSSGGRASAKGASNQEIAEQYRLKKEDFNNEERGNNNLSGNAGWDADESSIVQGKSLFRTGKGVIGEKGRRQYVTKLEKENGTERITINDEIRAEFIKENAYNADMRLIEADLKALGFRKVGFFIGQGELIQFKPLLACSGILFKDSKEIYLRYDHRLHSPRQIAIHEYAHSIYNSKLGKKIRNIIKNSIPLAERNAIMQQQRYQIYVLYSQNPDLAFEEFVCDVLAGKSEYSYSHFESLVNAFWDGDYEFIDNYKVSEYTESIDAGDADSTTSGGTDFDNVNLVSGEQGVAYALEKRKWYPDLSKKKLNVLNRIIKDDAETSVKNITDTANWLFTRISGTNVFAIYSTENINAPTLLYESKGKRAELEREYLLDLLEAKKNGESIDGKSTIIGRVSSGNWLRDGNSIQNSTNPVGRGRSNRNAGVLQGQSSRKPSRAFESVIRNLFEIQGADRRSSGDIERGGGRASVKGASNQEIAERYRLEREEDGIFKGYPKWVSEVISENEFGKLESELLNITHKLKDNYIRSRSGEYIIQTDDKLIYTNGDYENPKISKIIQFNSEYENEIDEARREIYHAEKNKSEINSALQVIEDTFGFGFADVITCKNYSTFAGAYGQGKGSNGTAVNRNRSKKSRRKEYYSRIREASRIGLDEIQEVIDEKRQGKYSVKGASNQEIAERFRLEREEDGIREQLKRVDGQLVDAKSVEKFSKALIAYTSSTSEKGVVMKGVSELIGLIKDGAEFSDIKNKALEIARGLIENAEALNDGEYIKYRDLSEKVSSANESNIDDLYRELSPDYPEFFDGETEVSKEQRLEKIAEVLENLEPVFDSSSNFEMATETLANKILTDIAGGRAESKSRRAKVYKAVERERELREKKVAAVRDYYLDRIEGEKERRRKREALGKIRRAELTIANKLYNPDNSRHIPTKLGEVTKALLDAVQSLRDSGKGEKDYIKNVETALLRLETEYRVLLEGTNEFEALNCDDVILIDGNVVFSEQYYENVLECIFNITQELENNEQSEAQSLDMLSSQTLESLDRCFVDLKQMINSSNKLLESRLNMGVYEAALSIVNDMRSEKKKKVVSAGEKDTDPGYFKGIESPETFFCTLGPSMEKVYKELRDRHSTEVENINALIEMCRDIGKIAGKKEDALLKLTDERAKKKIYQLESGEEIELTRMHIMSLYLLNKQTGPRGARNNIYDGGIAVEEINNKFNRKTLAQKPVKVTEKDVATLISTLSKRDIAIADRMGHYMKTFAAWGNEVSETVYGFKKYVMQNYWPRKVYKDGGEIGVLRRPRNIENISAGKTRTENSLPIVLGNAFQTFVHYGAEMAYHNAYTVQMLNFKRVLNYSQDGFSVKQEIYERHGKRAKAYIDNFSLLMNKAMKERCVELPFVGASLKMTKKALILYKLTTALKQPAAIFRAMSEMDLKHWAKLTNLLPADVEAMHKYAPISKWKEMGFYGNNIAPSIMQLATGGTFKDKFENAGMWLPSKLDDFTWRRIWQGCVSQTKAEYKNEIEYGTEEFYEKTAELFNDVIFRTQVVDSIFQKPLIMNSQNSLMREATAFQNEPLTTYNTLYRAWYDLKHKVPGAKEKAAKAVLATLLQSCWTELLVPGIMGLTTSVFFSAIGDEEEDEQGFLREYALPVVMGALSLGPVTDAISELTGQFNKGGHLSTQAFSDFVTLVGKVAEGKYTGHGATVKILSAAAHMFGVPVSGLKQHLSTIYGIGMKLSGSEHLARLAEYKYDRWLYDIKNEGNAKMFKEYMFKAYLSGDEELYKIMEKDLMEANPEEFNASTIASSMKSRQISYIKKNPDFEPNFRTRWNLTLPLAPETEDEAVDKSDYIAGLSFEQKEQFDDAIIFGTDNFIIELQDRIEELDDETRNAVLNGMSKYVEEMALYEVTDGEYVPDDDWILQAEDIADGYGWSVGDLIYYKSKYSISTITSENCAEALEAGMDMDTYGEYRKYYNNLESIKNSAGKVVRDKPTQLREYLRSKGYSAAEAKWITDLVK